MSEEITLSDKNVDRKSLGEELTRLYSQGFLTDITLSTEDGKNFEAHRILLASRSTYFQSILPRLKPDPVIFLKGIKGSHLDKILKFIYGSSVTVSKHQLKQILDVAKVLQVKGLQDVTPNDILSRSSVVSAGKFKPDSPLGSPLLTKLSSPSSSSQSYIEKSTMATFKSPSAPTGRRGQRTASVSTASTSGPSTRMQNGLLSQSDSEKEENQSNREASKVQNVVEIKVKKRGRGRPPKNRDASNQASTSTSTSTHASTSSQRNKKEASNNDPYEFEDEGSEANDRYKTGEKRRHGKDTEESEDEDNDANKKGSTNSLMNKQVISVKCKGELANLHLVRFIGCTTGHSIKYKEQWMTPREFAHLVGYTGKKYMENIQTDYGPLKALAVSGALKQARTMKQSSDDEEYTSKVSETRGRKKRRAQRETEEDEDEEEEEEEVNEEEEDSQEDDEEQTEREETDVATTTQDEYDDEEEEEDKRSEVDASSQTSSLDVPVGHSSGKSKKKKKKHRDEWKRHMTSFKNSVHGSLAISGGYSTHETLNTIALTDESSSMLLHERANEGHVISASNPFSLTTMDHSSKISPPSLMQEHHQHQQQTIYVMSPHPSMATPPTPQHNPFASMSPHPNHMSYVPVVSSTPASLNSIVSMSSSTPGPSNPAPKSITTTSSSSGGGSGGSAGKVLDIRCKSTTAQLFTSKYESGSKGKCIQLGDEWLTPNEFEDRAGSKAKKYLSSIKCLGRPLRVLVNSGELRGSGPPPAQKNKVHKVKSHTLSAAGAIQSSMQPIAPAPMQAPPTPSHISSAPQIPQNLGMVMNAQTPILLNQQQIPSSMMGGNQHNLMAGMTFTLAQPLEVRQNGQAM